MNSKKKISIVINKQKYLYDRKRFFQTSNNHKGNVILIIKSIIKKINEKLY